MNKAIGILKTYFIPHPENDHQPHILRSLAVRFAIMAIIVVQFVFLLGSLYVAPRVQLFGVILVNTLIDETNASRIENALPSLETNASLQAAAQEKANDMVANNYFAHTSPAGVTPWYWFEKVGYPFAYAGENLAVNFTNSEDVTSAWMNSPGHRANILNGNFTQIGMATAQGTFDGHPATYVVELFGTPAAAPIAFVNEADPTVKPVVAKPAPPIAAAPKKPAVKPAPVSAPVKPPVVVSVVASSTTTTTSSQNLFVAVKGAEAAAVPQGVAGSTSPAPQAAGTPAQGLLSNPRVFANYFYFLLIVIFGIGLGTHVFTKMELHHPRLIFGGLLVIVIAGLFILLNQSPAVLHATIL